MTDHQELRRLAEQATPGPWGRELSDNSYDWNAFVYTELAGGRTVASDAADRDAEFIAATNPQVVLALLDEIEALRRGQGAAPDAHTDTRRTPLHVTNPIPDSKSA